MAEEVIRGRYRLEQRIGHSGMSEVWLATDLELDRPVALKLLAPNADRQRFEREARAAAALSHPNINQLFDFGETAGRPYMVLEFLPGGTLEDQLGDDQPLPDEQTERIARDLADGLAHAHANGLIHRDLKPSNVLFDSEGRAKIADFGIAHMGDAGTLTEAGTVLGTAAYISPEQASGAPASDASDVYSFGVILYRMLTGRLPFESVDPMQLVLQHRDVAPPPISSLRADAPATLETTASAALAKDPRQRPPDGAALLAELGVPAGAGLTTAQTAVLGEDATQVLRAAPAAAAVEAYPAPPPERSRTPIVVAGLIALAVAGGVLAYEVTRPSSAPGDTGTVVPITLPSQSEPTTTAGSTTTADTTASDTTTTQQTTTSPPATTAPTTAPPPPTTAPPTTEPPPTTAPPPTTSPPPTTAAATTAANLTTPATTTGP